jgi:hypothetical protein
LYICILINYFTKTTKIMATRIKQVVDAATVAHLWAHQTQDHARTSTNNFYFNGTSIYSYGRHFRIAELITIPEDIRIEVLTDYKAYKEAIYGDASTVYGNQLVLFTARSYSNTTAKHKSLVSSAVSHMPMLVVQQFVEELRPDGLGEWELKEWNRGHQANIEYYIQEAKEAKAKAEKARSEWSVRAHTATVIRAAKDAILYLQVYGLYNDPTWSPCIVETLRPLEQFEKVYVAKDPVTEEKREKARLSREKSAKKKLEAEKEAWLEGTEEWKYNWSKRQSMLEKITKHFGVLLRVEDDAVQTTKQATVPVADARKLLRTVRLAKETGTDVQPEAGAVMVGHYAVSRITAAGDLIVGCHSIHNEEIERLAKREGWAEKVTIKNLSE